MPDTAPGGDPRRRVPRTDAVLADARLVAAADAARPAARSRRPSRRRWPGCGRGRSTPWTPSPSGAGGPAQACHHAAPGAQRHRRRAAHQPRPRPLSAAAVEAIVAAPAPPTSSSTSPPAGAPGAGGARSPRSPPPCPPPRPCTWSTTAPRPPCWRPPRWPQGSEIVVSRGELVEIGDGFRLPDLLAVDRRAAARGRHHEPHAPRATTRAPSGPRPGSSSRCTPRTSRSPVSPPRSSVARARRARCAPVVVDIGSGLLEPGPAAARRAGRRHRARRRSRPRHRQRRQAARRSAGGAAARAVPASSSGSAAHPLARALRVDKLTLAALEATLTGPPTPTAAALHADPARSSPGGRRALADRLGGVRRAGAGRSQPRRSSAAGGAPGLDAAVGRRRAPCRRSRPPLRTGDPAVLGRVERGRAAARPARRRPAETTPVLRRAARPSRSPGLA